MKISSYGDTDVGLKRRHNEDSWIIDERLNLYIVADGMGGHQAGEIASNITIRYFPALLRKFDLDNLDEIPVILERTINHIHKLISKEAEKDPGKKGMGTTLCLLLIRHNQFFCTYVGDSPIYLYREHELSKITKAHSFVQEQQDRGMITSREAKDHRYRNVLTQSVGGKKTLKIPILTGKIKENDLFLLCSDGLSNSMEDYDIISIISGNAGITQKVNKLINKAKMLDGSDNITAILVHVLSNYEEESLFNDDTIKYDNIIMREKRPSKPAGTGSSSQGPREGPGQNDAFDYGFSSSGESLPDIQSEVYVPHDLSKKLKVSLSILIIILIFFLVFLFSYLNRLQKEKTKTHMYADEEISMQTTKPGQERPEDTMPGPDIIRVRPTIKTEADSEAIKDPDLPVDQEDIREEEYADIHIEAPDSIERLAPPPETDTISIHTDHYKELKKSFLTNVYPNKSIEGLNHLCIRFAEYIKDFPDIHTIRMGSFSNPEMSVFGADFYRIVRERDFFIIMKDMDDIRWYMLFVGLYQSESEAMQNRSKIRNAGNVVSIRRLFETEPVIISR